MAETDAFYIMPISVAASIAKNTESNPDNNIYDTAVSFLYGGSMEAIIKTKLTGYVDTLKFEFAPELAQENVVHTITSEQIVAGNGKGIAIDYLQFTIPEDIPLGTYEIHITGERGDLQVKQTVYVIIGELSFDGVQSRIRSQSGPGY